MHRHAALTNPWAPICRSLSQSITFVRGQLVTIPALFALVAGACLCNGLPNGALGGSTPETLPDLLEQNVGLVNAYQLNATETPDGFIKRDPSTSVDVGDVGQNNTVGVKLDIYGRPAPKCPARICGTSFFFGGGKRQDDSSKLQTTLGNVTFVTDMSLLGMDPEYHKKAYEILQLCGGVFRNSDLTGTGNSDPACLVDTLETHSSSIANLDDTIIPKLSSQVERAFDILETLTVNPVQRRWRRGLRDSKTLRLFNFVFSSLSQVGVDPLKGNVGEEINRIFLQNPRAVPAMKDLVGFATVCTTHEEYPEKLAQGKAGFVNPDNSEFKSYPIYEYLRRTGAEVALPRTLPLNWQPHLTDGNFYNPRPHGGRIDPFDQEDFRKQVYTAWHHLWMFNLMLYELAEMWMWTREMISQGAFFDPWKVTKVQALRVIEQAPLRYGDMTKRFAIYEADSAATASSTCSKHDTDIEFQKELIKSHKELRAEWRTPQMASRQVISVGRESLAAEYSVTIPCPPKVSKDKCGLDATYGRPIESPWMIRLDRDFSKERRGNGELDLADRVWIIKGSVLPKVCLQWIETFTQKLLCCIFHTHKRVNDSWLITNLSKGINDNLLTDEGKIHEGFSLFFRDGIKSALDEDIQEIRDAIEEGKKRHVVLFTGHSLGGALSQISSLYYAKHTADLMEKGLLQIRAVTFGTPAWGDTTSYEELLKRKVIVHDIAVNIDPITKLNGEPELGDNLDWRKPFHYWLNLDEMEDVYVAQFDPSLPPFSGKLWSEPLVRSEGETSNYLLKFASLENVCSVFAHPTMAHMASYTAALTLVADYVPEADFGSALAAPLSPGLPLSPTSHQLRKALYEANLRVPEAMKVVRGSE